jgi:hypothetical protein
MFLALSTNGLAPQRALLRLPKSTAKPTAESRACLRLRRARTRALPVEDQALLGNVLGRARVLAGRVEGCDAVRPVSGRRA